MGKFYTHGLIYKTYDFIRNYHDYRKIRKAVKDVFYSDDFKMLIRKYLNVELDKDWLGRQYGIINPNIDIDGNFNIDNVIIEIDGDRTNSDEYVKTWLFRQLNIMGQLFNMKNLYSNITMDIKKVGPITQDNYLIVFEIAGRATMASTFKSLLKTLSVYVVTIGTVLGGLFYTHVI